MAKANGNMWELRNEQITGLGCVDNHCDSVRIVLGCGEYFCLWGVEMKYEITKGSERKTLNNDDSLDGFLNSMCEKLEYRPNGDLYWTGQDHRKDLIGKKAGSLSSSDGYVYIKFKQKRIAAHRVIFFMHNCRVPQEIDHANRVRSDNRIENLRECRSHGENMWNVSVQTRDKTSKYRGVCWDANRKKWMAYLKIKGVVKHIGRFTTEEEAAEKYNQFASKNYGEFANLNVITYE